MKRLITLSVVVSLGAVLAGCALFTPLPDGSDLSARLSAMPTAGLPLERPVRIHWSDEQVPYIDAESDTDLAVALGLAHAHLRLGQMEMLRRISQGRIAEMAGPLVTDIDHSIRLLGFDRAVPAIVADLPPATRAWTEAYVAGVNHYLMQTERLPHEFAVLGLEREPWTVADVITIGRLVSTDVNWLLWFNLLRWRDRPDWPQIWARMIDEGTASIPSFENGDTEDGGQIAALGELLAGLSRSGSNSIAVAGARSANGAALIANDPHLGFMLPNTWLIAAYRSPSYQVAGLMVPGLPFVAVGRNPWIAWGGTNMRAASSDLFDLAAVSDAAIETRADTIATRWWFDRDITLRDSPLGPVISDAPTLPGTNGQSLALRWVGHEPSDELSAMLGVNKARDWADFTAALHGFAVPGQNMLYADHKGHVGQVSAVHLPARPAAAPDDIVAGPEALHHWRRLETSAALPSVFDPPSGFLASANNRPAPAGTPLGFFFAPNDRVQRLQQLVGSNGAVDLEHLAKLQSDVYMASAVALRDRLLEQVAALDVAAALTPPQADALRTLRAWDGHYRANSAGAVAFESLLRQFVESFYGEEERAIYGGYARRLMMQDLGAAPRARLRVALLPALTAAAEGLERFGTWGEMHRLGLTHPLADAPLIGGRYAFTDLPLAGSSHTVMKTAHGLTDRRHDANYGSNARHLSDMSDMDENYFVLLGGQDGWLRSTTFLDQLALWRRGDYIRVPLRPETARRAFPHAMVLAP